jgi:hypothetical protein
MTYASLAKRIVVTFALIGITGSVQAGTEDEVKALFSKFIAAQNAHDLKASARFCRIPPDFCGSPVILQSGAGRLR